MSKVMTMGVVIGLMAAGSAWAMFETNKELVANSKISMEDAIKSATAAVPGKAAEADLTKHDGRTVWNIEVIDYTNKSQTLYVDAQNGMVQRKNECHNHARYAGTTDRC